MKCEREGVKVKVAEHNGKERENSIKDDEGVTSSASHISFIFANEAQP